MDLNFKVKEQIINRTDNNTIVNLSENYLQLCFTFQSNDWTGLTKFVLFKHGEKSTRIGLIEDKVIVPASLLTGNRLVFSLYGLDTPNDEVYRITTNQIRLHLLDSGYTSEVDDLIDDEEVDIVEEIYIAIAAKSDTVYVDEQLALKTNITDIKNNLTSSDVDKPLSALQGKELKTLIDGITVNKADTADDGYFATYTVEVDGVDVGDRINIPKDFLLKDADILICEEDDVPVEGYRVGDYYFDFLVNTVDDDDPKHLYLLCNDLKDVYRGDNTTIVIVDGVISVKSDVFADKSHTHTKSDITDFNHNHDDRYYTETEVNTIIEELKHDLSNYLIIDTDKPVIQTGEVSDIKIRMVENNFPVGNKDIYFYEKFEPSISMSSDKSIIQVDEVADVTARLKDEDGSLVQDMPIYFYTKEETNLNNMEE